jgi:hypothetical protein
VDLAAPADVRDLPMAPNLLSLRLVLSFLQP